MEMQLDSEQSLFLLGECRARRKICTRAKVVVVWKRNVSSPRARQVPTRQPTFARVRMTIPEQKEGLLVVEGAVVVQWFTCRTFDRIFDRRVGGRYIVSCCFLRARLHMGFLRNFCCTFQCNFVALELAMKIASVN